MFWMCKVIQKIDYRIQQQRSRSTNIDQLELADDLFDKTDIHKVLAAEDVTGVQDYAQKAPVP